MPGHPRLLSIHTGAAPSAHLPMRLYARQSDLEPRGLLPLPLGLAPLGCARTTAAAGGGGGGGADAAAAGFAACHASNADSHSASAVASSTAASTAAPVQL